MQPNKLGHGKSLNDKGVMQQDEKLYKDSIDISFANIRTIVHIRITSWDGFGLILELELDCSWFAYSRELINKRSLEIVVSSIGSSLLIFCWLLSFEPINVLSFMRTIFVD